MYPNDDLDHLAKRKVILRGSIAVNRWRCISAGKRLTQPLDWVDRGVGQWQKISPFLKFGAVPLGFLVKKLIFPKHRVVGSISSIVKWAPAAWTAFKAFRSMKSNSTGSQPFSP